MSPTQDDMSKNKNKKARELYVEPAEREEGRQNSFYNMRQKDKLKYINKKIQHIRRGTGRECQESLEILRQEMEDRVNRARILRMQKMKSIEKEYAAEKQAAIQNFHAVKQDLYHSLKEELEKCKTIYGDGEICRDIVLNEVKKKIWEKKSKPVTLPQMTMGVSGLCDSLVKNLP